MKKDCLPLLQRYAQHLTDHIIGLKQQDQRIEGFERVCVRNDIKWSNILLKSDEEVRIWEDMRGRLPLKASADLAINKPSI